MLRDLINGVDIHGKQNTRRNFRNSVEDFKEDSRLHVKKYKFQHSPVQELHGARYLACVKSGDGALLVESDGKLRGVVVLSDMPTSIYSDAMQEGLAQIKHHVQSRRPRKANKNTPVVAAAEKTPAKKDATKKPAAKGRSTKKTTLE